MAEMERTSVLRNPLMRAIEVEILFLNMRTTRTHKRMRSDNCYLYAHALRRNVQLWTFRFLSRRNRDGARQWLSGVSTYLGEWLRS